MYSLSCSFILQGATCASCFGIANNLLSDQSEFTLAQAVFDEVSKRMTVKLENCRESSERILAKLHDDLSCLEGVLVADSVLVEDDTVVSVSLAQHPVLSFDNADWQLQEGDSFELLADTEDAETAPATPIQAVGKWAKVRRIIQSHWFQGALGLVMGLVFMAVSMAVPGLPLAVMIAMGVASFVFTLILGARSYYNAFMKLVKTRTLTMDTLFAISTLTVIAVSIAAFFVPWLPMMLEAGLLIFGFRHIGQAIEESVKQKMTLDKRFQDELPRRVRFCLSPKQGEMRSLSSIMPGDILRIEPGELIPLDGECLSEWAEIYDVNHNGSTEPQEIQAGKHLNSGMRLCEHSPPILLRVTASVAHSHLARLDQCIEMANSKKAPIQESTSRILQYFIPGVIALAVIAGIVIGVFFPPALAIQCAVTVLVSACPCTLGLVVPLAVKIGMQKAAEHGVQFKNAKKLQAAGAIDAVVFDLNGTLNEGAPRVSDFIVVADADETDLLTCAASLEQASRHPAAKAIYAYAQAQSIVPLIADNIASNHYGRSVVLGEDQWAIGNADMMHSMGVEQLPAPALQIGESLVYLSKNGRVQGYFILSDPLRRDARRTIQALVDMGKEVHLCTGADEATAQRYAQLLGIPADRVAAGCVGLVEQEHERGKEQYIRQLQARGLKVAMIGDGGNDALPLKTSDFGIAVDSGLGSRIAQSHAGAVTSGQSLLSIASAFAVAEQCVSNIRRNLIFSLVFNIVMVALPIVLLVSVGFALNPGIGVALMAVLACCSLGIAWHFKKQGLKHLQEPVAQINEGSTYERIGRTIKPGTKLALGCEDTSGYETARTMFPCAPNTVIASEAKQSSVRSEIVENNKDRTSSTGLLRCARNDGLPLENVRQMY